MARIIVKVPGIPNGVPFPEGTPRHVIEAEVAKYLKDNPPSMNRAPPQKKRGDIFPTTREHMQSSTPIPAGDHSTVSPQSPMEKLFGGIAGNFNKSMDATGAPNFMRMPENAGMENIKRPYPTPLLPVNEDMPLVGQTPKEFLPEFAGAIAQTMFPVAKGAGAIAEVTLPALRGYAADVAAKTGIKLNDGDEWDRALKEIFIEAPFEFAEYLMGSAAGKMMGFVGEQFFGHVPNPSQKAATQFAREQQRGQVGVMARKESQPVKFSMTQGDGGGSPRLAIDNTTGGELLALMRFLLIGSRGSNVKAGQAAHWINSALDNNLKNFKFVNLPSGQQYSGVIPADQAMRLGQQVLKETRRKIPGIKQSEFMNPEQSGERWLKNLFKPGNEHRLEAIRKADPDAHALILSRKLSDEQMKHTRQDDIFGQVLDGKKFNAWVQNNQKQIRKIYGDDVFSNISRFSNYAQFTDNTTARASKFAAEHIDINKLGRLGVEGTTVAQDVVDMHIALPAQAYAWGMSHALMDTGSMWFRLFQFLPKTEAAVKQIARTGVVAAEPLEGFKPQ